MHTSHSTSPAKKRRTSPGAASDHALSSAEDVDLDRSLIFLGRQPILDRQGRLVAHDFLFRDARDASEASIDDPLAATARVLVGTFSELEMGGIAPGVRTFINADPKLEIADHVDSLPSLKLVFDLPPGLVADAETIERLERLREAGFELCLDDFAYRDERIALIEYVQFVKVDFSRHSSVKLRKIARELDEHHVTRIACRIENAKSLRVFDQQEWELAQGFYFAHPEQVVTRRPSVRRRRILEVLGQIDEETTTEEIAKSLRGVPHVVMNLLGMANLLRSEAGDRIESIEQAVVMLGRKRLVRWLHLLVFASDDPNGCADPLCQVIAMRSAVMENLAKRAGGSELDPDRAALTGMLSLTPAFLDLDPKEVCGRLGLDYPIEKALVRREGRLGQLLSLVEAREGQASAVVGALLRDLGLDWNDLSRAEIAAVEWSEGLSSLST